MRSDPESIGTGSATKGVGEGTKARRHEGTKGEGRSHEGMGIRLTSERSSASLVWKDVAHACGDNTRRSAIEPLPFVALFPFVPSCLRAFVPLFPLIAILSFAGPVRATPLTPENLIAEAVREYGDAMGATDRDLKLEQFRRARRLFHQVIKMAEVDNASLYVNLGNAALQCEDLGEAVLAFRRALLIEPGDERARQNLDYARRLLPEWVPRPPSQSLLDTFFFWHRTMPRSALALVAAVCFAVAALLAALAIRWKKAWARNVALVPLAVWVALIGLSLWGDWSRTADEAVVTAPRLVARAADSPGAPARFAEPLPAGTEVRILEKRDAWFRVRLFNNRDGWVRASGVTTLRRPDSS